MKYRVQIYMKSGNVIEAWFTELTWNENGRTGKTLKWKTVEPYNIVKINVDQIEAIVQVEAKSV